MTHEGAGQQTCYRHPNRPAYIQCQRCSRFICPEDMREASVGFQCPECVNRGQAAVRQPRTMAGGAVSSRVGAVTFAIIGLNVAAQLVVMATGGARNPNLSGFFTWGWLSGVEVAQGDYWRLVTAAFLHGGLVHIGLNMLSLYLFGPYVEEALGRARYIATYLMLAVGSSVLVYLLEDPFTPTIGASGAVFGLFGLALIFLIRTRQNITGMIVILAINGYVSLGEGISWQGHLGGFLTGIVLGLMFAYAPRERRTVYQVATFTALAVVFVAAVLWRTEDLRSALPGLV
ncbi:rhomboid family intramembrane serine protease [Aeromicrobium flavum]|uniref:Rhomboid family intramembrane serine protease n=1 Tax=Aeromicrobium flavum TaxID=416568 RepID=A0A512HU44_9ACTN|nr:rhomboid family intramembrane serine protease [Aeromicrobium flavum]GEO88973.1 rhomboid family intramembrane serine protease [Aeromicrobium flavum]